MKTLVVEKKYSDVITLTSHPLNYRIKEFYDVNGTLPAGGQKFGDVIMVSGNGKVMLASLAGRKKSVIYEKDSFNNWRYKQTLSGYVGAELLNNGSYINYTGSRFVMTIGNSVILRNGHHASRVLPPNHAGIKPVSFYVNATDCSNFVGSGTLFATGHTSVYDKDPVDGNWKLTMNIAECSRVYQSKYQGAAALSKDGTLLVIRGKASVNGDDGSLDIYNLSTSINFRHSQASGFGFVKSFDGGSHERLGMLGTTISSDSKYIVTHSLPNSYAADKSKITTYYLDDSDNTWKQDMTFDITVSGRTHKITGDWNRGIERVGKIRLSQGTGLNRTLVVGFPKDNLVKVFQLTCTANNRCTRNTSQDHEIKHTDFGYNAADNVRFGMNVAISGDGLKLLISADESTKLGAGNVGINPSMTGTNATKRGVAYITTRSSINSTSWTTPSSRFDSSKEFGILRPKVLAGSGNTLFGYGLGFNEAGTVIVLGDPLRNAGAAGNGAANSGAVTIIE